MKVSLSNFNISLSHDAFDMETAYNKMETIKYDISTSNANDQFSDLSGLGNHEFMQGDPLTQASYIDLGMEEPPMVMAKMTAQERRQHKMICKQQHRISELIFHLRQMRREINAVGEKSTIS